VWKNWTECSLAQHRFPIRFVSFFVSYVCLLVRVTMVDKNKAVVGCLLATLAIMLSKKKKRKRKMWSKKWYSKKNIKQGSPLFYSFWKVECLEIMPLWCQQVKWGKCGIPWVNCAVLCVKDDWKGQFWGLQYCLSKLRSLLSFSIRYDVTQ